MAPLRCGPSRVRSAAAAGRGAALHTRLVRPGHSGQGVKRQGRSRSGACMRAPMPGAPAAVGSRRRHRRLRRLVPAHKRALRRQPAPAQGGPQLSATRWLLRPPRLRA